jgi:hypothetical protein
MGKSASLWAQRPNLHITHFTGPPPHVNVHQQRKVIYLSIYLSAQQTLPSRRLTLTDFGINATTWFFVHHAPIPTYDVMTAQQQVSSAGVKTMSPKKYSRHCGTTVFFRVHHA